MDEEFEIGGYVITVSHGEYIATDKSGNKLVAATEPELLELLGR